MPSCGKRENDDSDTVEQKSFTNWSVFLIINQRKILNSNLSSTAQNAKDLHSSIINRCFHCGGGGRTGDEKRVSIKTSCFAASLAMIANSSCQITQALFSTKNSSIFSSITYHLCYEFWNDWCIASHFWRSCFGGVETQSSNIVILWAGSAVVNL